MRFGLAFLTALLTFVLAVPAAGSSDPVAETAKAKSGKCKKGQVKVKFPGRTGCMPIGKVLPKPKAVDLRLAHLQQVLKFDPAKALKGKKRKRAKTLQSGFGAAGKRAQKKLLKAVPKALAFIDRKKKGGRSSRLMSAPAFASAGCQPGPAGPTGHTGGASVGLLGDNGGYIDAEAGGGLRVRVTFVSCGGINNFHLPECPTANGSVDGKGSGEFRATIEIWDGGQLVSRNSSVFEEKAKVHGEVGPDAKLKFIEVEHTQEVFIVASGGIVIRGGVTRKVRIDMPGGRYDPARASVRFFGDSISSNSGATAFASTAEGAIRAYKSIEPGWSTFKPPFCAEPVFTPDSNTLKLSKGKTGQLSIYAKAKDGGRATAARWTLSGAENADFSPTSSQDPAPNVSYTVTNAPKGGQIKLTVKFTSTAGVGEKSWTQPTEADEPPAEKFAGSISGTAVYGPFELGEGNSLSADWSGHLEVKMEPPIEIPGFPIFSYNYKITTGSITYSFTGALNDCHVEGGGPIDLGSQIDVSNSVLLTLLQGDPRPYGFFVPMPLSPSANVPGTASECEDPEDEKSIEWPPGIGLPLVTRATVDEGRVLSPDESFSGSASGNNGIGSPAQTWQWSMAPVP